MQFVSLSIKVILSNFCQKKRTSEISNCYRTNVKLVHGTKLLTRKITVLIENYIGENDFLSEKNNLMTCHDNKGRPILTGGFQCFLSAIVLFSAGILLYLVLIFLLTNQPGNLVIFSIYSLIWFVNRFVITKKCANP